MGIKKKLGKTEFYRIKDHIFLIENIHVVSTNFDEEAEKYLILVTYLNGTSLAIEFSNKDEALIELDQLASVLTGN